MFSKNTVVFLASLTCFRITNAAAIPDESPADTLVQRRETPSRTTGDIENSFFDKRTNPPAPTYTQWPAGSLTSATIPSGPGSVICLCNDENYGNCMCIDDSQNGAWDTCLSNRGSDGQWSGFSNDKVSSVSISGPIAGACKFFDDADCQGQPMLVGSAATGPFLQPQMPKGTNDKLSSIFCGEPQEIVLGGA